MNTVGQTCPARILAIFYVLLGAFLTSFGITVLDFAQGHIFGDWSGIAPVGRLSNLPYRFGLAGCAIFFVNAMARLLRYTPMVERSDQIVLGALCGLVTIGSLLGPWISDSDHFFLICLLGVLGASFWYRAALNRSGQEKKAT